MDSLSDEWARPLLWTMRLARHEISPFSMISNLISLRFNVLHPEKVPSAIERYRNEVIRILGVLNTALEGKTWLVGDKCTFADLAFMPWNTRLDSKGMMGHIWTCALGIVAWLHAIYGKGQWCSETNTWMSRDCSRMVCLRGLRPSRSTRNSLQNKLLRKHGLSSLTSHPIFLLYFDVCG